MKTIGNARVSVDRVNSEWKARWRRSALADLSEVVYFTIHFGHIKIGTTTALQSRMSHLGCDWSDLLVVIPGGRDTEAEMHQQFAHLRASGPGLGVEHFVYCDELLDFINAKRADMNLPPV